jgi:hypothetical protein
MKPSWRKFLAVLFASMIAAAFAGPAGASKLHACNAGGGNGSETTPATDCDPGNSVNNNGGD